MQGMESMSRTASSEVTTAQWQQNGINSFPRGRQRKPQHGGKREGALLYDLDGRRFIDFAGAIGTLNVIPIRKWWSEETGGGSDSPGI